MAAEPEQLFLARRELVAWASHDLRSLIASLQAMIEAAQDAVVPIDHYLGAIHDRSPALSALVDDLFQLAPLDAGSLSLKLRVEELDPLVARCVRGQIAEARRWGVELALDVAAGSLPCAPEAVARVLVKLVSNTVRFTSAGGVTAAGRRLAPRQAASMGPAVLTSAAGRVAQKRTGASGDLFSGFGLARLFACARLIQPPVAHDGRIMS